MSLFRASDPDNQHDVLASNLLFATMRVEIAKHFHKIVTAGPKAYQAPLACLKLVRDVQTEDQPPFCWSSI